MRFIETLEGYVNVDEILLIKTRWEPINKTEWIQTIIETKSGQRYVLFDHFDKFEIKTNSGIEEHEWNVYYADIILPIILREITDGHSIILNEPLLNLALNYIEEKIANKSEL